MAKNTLIVGCRLPNGIVIDMPEKVTKDSSFSGPKSITLAGANRELIAGAVAGSGSGYGTTEVDKEWFDVWSAFHQEFTPLKVGAIFVAKDVASAASIANELKDEPTGFEPMAQEGQGVTKSDESV